MNAVQKTIRESLELAHKTRRKRKTLLFLGALFLILILAAMIDRFVIFDGWERWIGWVCGLAAAVGFVRHFGNKGPSDAISLAHQVEEEAGETASVVATAIDPEVRKAESSETGRALLERLDQRAADALKAAPPSFGHWLKVPLALTLAVLLFGIAVVAWQGGLGLKRILLPWSASPYTAISLTGPTEPIPEGKSFTLTAKVSGIPVEEIALYREDSETPLSQGSVNDDGELSLTVDGLDGPATFIVRGGDGESAPLLVTPYLLPSIVEFKTEVTPPEYVGSNKTVETEPSFTAIRGSKALFQIRLRAPAVSIAFEKAASPREDEFASPKERERFPNAPVEEPMETSPIFRAASPDSMVWEALYELAAAREILYRLVTKGEKGDVIRNEEPWRISVFKDEPPEIKITSHNGDEVIKQGNETVGFQLRAVDDIGLNEVWLVFRKPGQPPNRQKLALPSVAGMTWSGEALLDLTSLDLKPFDILAVHAEAVDRNTIDGPGIGRSEIVFIEIPFSESSEDDDSDGGGSVGSPQINLLELQMEILRTAIVTPDGSPQKDRNALAFDQRQNAEFTGILEARVRNTGPMELADVLAKALQQMVLAYRTFERDPPSYGLPPVEAALGHLIEAAKLLQETEAEAGSFQDLSSSEGMNFTLSKPKPTSSDSSEETESNESSESESGLSEAEKKALANLMEEVKRQLNEQQSLNESQSRQAAGQPEKGGRQSAAQGALAADARSAAADIRGLPSASNNKGESRAAAEELERAARLQEENADALAEEDGEASSKLGAESAEALREALKELASQLDAGTFNIDAQSPAFERLVSDYLRAISYE